MHSFAPVMVIVVGTLLLAGCPPPPLSLDEPDARPNSPPGIISVRSETGDEFKVGEENSVIINESTMTLSLVDSDVDDTLYIRGFLDYNATSHPSASAVCNVGPSTPRSSERTLTCSLLAYCSADDIPTNPHVLDIVVSDRTPDDGGDNPALPFFSVEPPGLQATRSYPVACQASL